MKELSPEQVERLRPEARARYEKRLKEVKKNRKIVKYAGIGLGVAAIFLILSMTVLFNISSITVDGTGKKYTQDQIVMASGLNIGDNMVRTSFKKVEERIEKSLPYVYDAAITKTITGKITITITDTRAAIAVKTPQGFMLANPDGKVLEIVKELPKSKNLMYLRLKGSITATVGETFTINDAAEKALYDEITANLADVKLRDHITEMDLTQRSSIKLVYQGRLRLLLGSSEKLDEKLKSASKVIEKENAEDPALIAEVNLTIPKKAFVNPIESLDIKDKDDDSTTQIINPEEGQTSSTDENSGEETNESTENSGEETNENTDNSGDSTSDDEDEETTED